MSTTNSEMSLSIVAQNRYRKAIGASGKATSMVWGRLGSSLLYINSWSEVKHLTVSRLGEVRTLSIADYEGFIHTVRLSPNWEVV